MGRVKDDLITRALVWQDWKAMQQFAMINMLTDKTPMSPAMLDMLKIGDPATVVSVSKTLFAPKVWRPSDRKKPYAPSMVVEIMWEDRDGDPMYGDVWMGGYGRVIEAEYGLSLRPNDTVHTRTKDGTNRPRILIPPIFVSHYKSMPELIGDREDTTAYRKRVYKPETDNE